MRLSARLLATRIQLMQSILVQTVARVRVSASPDEEIDGVAAVVLELVDSERILLRERGTGRRGAAELAARIAEALNERGPLIAADSAYRLLYGA